MDAPCVDLTTLLELKHVLNGAGLPRESPSDTGSVQEIGAGADVGTRPSTGVHLLAAFSARLRGVIGQLRVAPEANEISAALELLKTLSHAGITITGDATFTQREICRVIIEGGGGDFFTVTDNQPASKADIAVAFAPDSALGGMVVIA